MILTISQYLSNNDKYICLFSGGKYHLENGEILTPEAMEERYPITPDKVVTAAIFLKKKEGHIRNANSLTLLKN